MSSALSRANNLAASESESSDEEEDDNWDDALEEEDDEKDESQTVCLFCDDVAPSAAKSLKHALEHHSFDLPAVKRALGTLLSDVFSFLFPCWLHVICGLRTSFHMHAPATLTPIVFAQAWISTGACA